MTDAGDIYNAQDLNNVSRKVIHLRMINRGSTVMPDAESGLAFSASV
jgi:hypothetical protein